MQLDDIGLIEKRRQGQGKPSILYVKDFSTVNTELSTVKADVDFLKSKKLTSESKENELLKVKKIDSNHTNQKNHTDCSHTDSIDSADPVDNSDNSTSDSDVGFAGQQKKDNAFDSCQAPD